MNSSPAKILVLAEPAGQALVRTAFVPAGQDEYQLEFHRRLDDLFRTPATQFALIIAVVDSIARGWELVEALGRARLAETPLIMVLDGDEVVPLELSAPSIAWISRQEWSTALTRRLAPFISLLATGRGVGDLSEPGTEAQRSARDEQLRHSQRIEAVGKLAGGIAHDFNNLLAVILLQTDLLLARTGRDDPQRARIEEIRAATERASGLTRQLLTFSRAHVMQPRILDLNSVVTDTTRMLRRLIGEDIELRITLDPEPPQILADPDQLAQVIMNLAINACDAMPRGGRFSLETECVEIGLDQATPEAPAGSYALLSASDTGHGMSRETRDRAFEPFFSTRGPGQGSGLGLSTVYGIVRQSGGQILVESEPGAGTTFHIFLPVVQEAAVARSEIPEQPLLLGSETVLVVEDEEIVRRLACEVLIMHGYQVVAAGHGAEAIALVRDFAGPIHLLLTDVIMPKMGGPELARELLQMRPSLRVLYMSGYPEERVGEHGVDDAGAEFVAKPFTRDELARRVREVLDAARA